MAIIPARGGSKRLPRKNLLLLAGKPLIAWTIEAAICSGALSRIIVTSDDDDILEVAGAYPQVELIKRPEQLATDNASSIDVLMHALDEATATAPECKYTMLLQPTSPLRTSVDVSASITLITKSGADSVISVCPTEHSPIWCNVLDISGNMDNFLPKKWLNVRSQDLPDYYRLNGAIYVAKTQVFRKYQGFFMPNSKAFVMDQESSIDIDTELDFMLASMILLRQQRL